jgi:hypothetical protein
MNEWIKWLIQIFIREEFDKKKHYELMKKIRNTISLNDNELKFIDTLPKKELLLIININNIHIERMNNLFFPEEKSEK